MAQVDGIKIIQVDGLTGQSASGAAGDGEKSGEIRREIRGHITVFCMA